MKDILHHLFLPHESNNHRAKFLHHSTVILLIIALFVTQFFVSFTSQTNKEVLGITSHITVSELLALTNTKREEQGLKPLRINDQLSLAAAQKAQNMLEMDYWSHNAPDGTTPWVFVKSSGYDYLYAGENLARGFTTSSDVVDAWMASQGHKENILSQNYDDIGFAIVDGRLTGDDTVLVVQMFGRSKQALPQSEFANPPSQAERGVVVTSDMAGQTASAPISQADVASIQSQPLIDIELFSKSSSLILLSVLVMLLLLDVFIIERRQVARILSHNLDHVIFLSIIVVVVVILGRGAVL